jgi:hypothetical protein
MEFNYYLIMIHGGIYPAVDITVAGGVVTTVCTLVGGGLGMLAGATLTIDAASAPAGLLSRMQDLVSLLQP